MDIIKLRDKFFRECCAKQEDGLQDVNMTPHNTFEWFVKHFTRRECKQCSKATDELICHSCASNDYAFDIPDSITTTEKLSVQEILHRYGDHLTEEQYLEALNIIEAYEEQLRIANVSKSLLTCKCGKQVKDLFGGLCYPCWSERYEASK